MLPSQQPPVKRMYDYVITLPTANRPRQENPLLSSQLQQIITIFQGNVSISPVTSVEDSIRMLILLANGEQRLVTFSLPKEECSIREILEQVNVPITPETNIEVTEANFNGINYIVTVGSVQNFVDYRNACPQCPDGKCQLSDMAHSKSPIEWAKTREAGAIFDVGDLTCFLTIMGYNWSHKEALHSAMSVTLRLCTKIEPTDVKLIGCVKSLSSLLQHEDPHIVDGALRCFAAIADRFTKRVNPTPLAEQKPKELLEWALQLMKIYTVKKSFLKNDANLENTQGGLSNSTEPNLGDTKECTGLQQFINVLFAMAPEECNAFLQFMTDCSSSPSNGLALELDPLVTIVRKVNADLGFVNIKDYENLLYLAAARNQVEVVKSLIFEKGIDVNARDLNSSTALHVGSKNGHLEVVKLLVEKKANINATEINGLTPLHLAICKSHFEMSNFLIKNGANVNIANGFYWTPLHFAAYKGFSLKIVDTLIAKGADINAKEDTNKKTALYLKLDHYPWKVMNMLVANGANFNAPDRTSLTPLHLAACKGHLEIVKCLLDKGADVNAKAITSITPLHLAVEDAKLELVELLLKKGADVNALIDNVYRTPLHLAAERFNDKVTNVLLKYGAVVNATNLENNTALNLAVQKRNYRNLEVVEELLKYGADVSIRNRDSRTSLDNAVSYLAYAKLLIKFTLLMNFSKNYENIINLSSYKYCEHYSELASYLNSCVCEILQMKTHKIKENLSLYEFLANNFNLHLLCNIHLSVRLARIDHFARYPLYSDIILDKSKRLLKRADLIDKLSKIQFYTYKLDIIHQDLEGKKIILDHDSINNITEYLSNDDLLNFIAAFDSSKKHTIDICKNNVIKRARLE